MEGSKRVDHKAQAEAFLEAASECEPGESMQSYNLKAAHVHAMLHVGDRVDALLGHFESGTTAVVSP